MLVAKKAWCTQEPTVCCRDLYSVLSPITWICRIAGIFPLTLEGPVGKRKYSTSCGLLIYSLTVLVLVITGLYAWTDHTNERRMKVSEDPVVHISINFEVMLEIISMVIMVVTAVLCKDKFATAIDTLSLQDISLRKLGTKLNYTADSKQHYIQLAIIILIISILFTYDFTYQMNFNTSHPLNWLSWVCPNIIRIASTCLFADVIIVVKQRFGTLNAHLRKMVEETMDSPPVTISTGTKMCNGIRSISKIHGSLCEVALSVNHIFSYNIIAGVIYALVILTTSMYYIYHEIKHPDCSYVQVFGSVGWALISFGHIFYLVTVCYFAQDQASLTGKLIHKFEISAVDTPLNNVVDTTINILKHIEHKVKLKQILHLYAHAHIAWPIFEIRYMFSPNTYSVCSSYMIQSFSMQLHHEKIEFSCAGLFPLDATLIQSIVGAVTTYLIILIQFDT